MQSKSNAELLALLVGREKAKALSSMPLAELFGFSKPRQMNLLCEEEMASYVVHPALEAAKELFLRCFHEQMKMEDLCFTSPEKTKMFLCSKIGHLEHEVFWCLWLDNQNRLIVAEEMFRGTINQAPVHPREIVKRGLAVNAAAVILAHNHPSGSTEPSRADENITTTIKNALYLVDIRVLDHIVVAGAKAVSFAERCMI